MSLRRLLALVLVAAACVAGLPAAPARAESLADQVAADRAKLDAALAQYNTGLAEQAALDAQVDAASSELDALVARQQLYQARLNARAVAMYRSGDARSTLLLLFSASSVADLASRLDLLDQLARKDAENIEALKQARADARTSAEGLLQLQEQQAAKLDALAEELARARQELAGSQSALAEYEARVAAAAAAAAAAKRAASNRPAPDQNLSGTGDWQTANASHYSANFTGRGASGEQIGPYSMIVAHKSLPFGTLVEIEYNGKRCVARVADRGPYVAGRDFDLGPGVVRVLGFSGVHQIRWRLVGQ